MLSKLLNKYNFNLSLLLVASFLYCSLFWVLIRTNNFYGKISWQQSLLGLGLTVLSLHYLLNLLHIASHRQLSRQGWLNDFLGHFISVLTGLSFTVFRVTHQLHHAFANHPQKDPDYQISTKGSLWLIATRIFYHDYYFFSRKHFLKQNNWLGYLADRAAQTALMTGLVLAGQAWIIIQLWIPAILIIGTLYGWFQFYFPHYSTKTIDRWRCQPQHNLLQKLVLFSVDLSAAYHFRHHQKIQSNLYYFPFAAYLSDLSKHKSLYHILQDRKYLRYREAKS